MKSRLKVFRQSKPERGAGKGGAQPPKLAAIPQDRVIFGIHAAEMALSNPNRVIRQAYLTGNAAARLASLVAARNIPVTEMLPRDFDALLGPGAVHQGAVLLCETLVQPTLDDFLDAL